MTGSWFCAKVNPCYVPLELETTINPLTMSSFLTFCKDLAINGQNLNFYKKVYILLNSTYILRRTRNHRCYGNRCIKNVLHIISKLMNNNPSATQKRTNSNKTCGMREYTSSSPTTIVKLLDGFLTVQDDLKECCLKVSIKCSKCGCDAISKRTLHINIHLLKLTALREKLNQKIFL